MKIRIAEQPQGNTADRTLTRRRVLQGTAALAATAFNPVRMNAYGDGHNTATAAAKQTLVVSDRTAIVETTAGKIHGYTRNQIFTFRGIPYGAPTSGAARFMPPAKVQPWSGIRNAYHFGHASPQGAIGFLTGDELKFIVRNFPGPQGEDCLCLNVWTPAIHDHEKRAVMVWLHGGGFQIGSGSSEPVYDGENLAKHDVVMVSVNHRLGPMGFLDLFGFGERYASSANVGMLDLVAALEWVRDNIANFGGDPGNVTIFGQSGGGGKVSTLMAMPAARGLFHKAIVQSGSMLNARKPANAQRLTAAVVEELGLTSTRIDELQNVPYDQLVRVSDEAIAKAAPHGPPDVARMADALGFGPVADGRVVPEDFWKPAAPTVSANVPLMVGTNLNELTVATDHPEYALWTEADLSQKISERFGAKTPEILAAFQRGHPDAKPFDLYSIISCASWRQGAVTQAERKAALGAAPAYLYWFTWGSPLFEGRPGSCHGLEMAFTFDNSEVGDYMTGGGPRAKALAGKLSGAWVNFARTGNPNHAGLPAWPAFSAEKCPTMFFNDVCQVLENPDTEERKMLTKQEK